MLLTLDVGNTNTVLGVFRGAELAAHWRLTTARDQTVDEYGILTRNLFTLAGLDAAAIEGVIISSVVPPLNGTLAEMARRYCGVEALFVEPGVKTGMPILYDNPQEVGADRIVNSVAAFEKYGGPCIVVDFGTAINFDAISAKGEYLGGVIALHAIVALSLVGYRPRRFLPAPHGSRAWKSKTLERLSARTQWPPCRPDSIMDISIWWTAFWRA